MAATTTPPLDPTAAIARLLARVEPVSADRFPVNPSVVAGRVLEAPLALDRDSPALDVSAMDGFAVRLEELNAAPLELTGECRIGEAPAELPAESALRIFTGCPVPRGADTVVRLERAEVRDGRLALLPEADPPLGADIRRQGENALAGAPVLEAGHALSPAAIAAAVTTGVAELSLFRPVRVVVITTGNELVRGPGDIPPWRLRDSNGPALVAMLSGLAWIDSIAWRHGFDELGPLADTLQESLAEADVVVFTGGVSKGDHDLVRPAIERVGGEVVFHRIAARPGQPTLGAIADGKPIVGLPGNPLSVLCAGRRVLAPVLRKLAGFADPDPPSAAVELRSASDRKLPITWWRPVRLAELGVAELASLMGSGDVIGPAMTDGFVEVPPNRDGSGPFAFYSWRL